MGFLFQFKDFIKISLLALALLATGSLIAVEQDRQNDGLNGPPDLSSLQPQQNRIDRIASRYQADRSNLNRFYIVKESPNTRERMRKFYLDWLSALLKLPADTLTDEERKGLESLKSDILDSNALLDEQARQQAAIQPLVPFAPTIIQLAEDRQKLKKVNSQEAAGQVDEISRQIEQLCASVEAKLQSKQPGELVLTAENLAYAAETVGNLRSYLRRWYGFYNGYDPLFTWWMRVPYEQADNALEKYIALLDEHNENPDETQEDTTPSGLTAESVLASYAPQSESDVPDLREMLMRKQGKMELVIAQFQSDFGRGRGQRGGRGTSGQRSRRVGQEERERPSQRRTTGERRALNRPEEEQRSAQAQQTEEETQGQRGTAGRNRERGPRDTAQTREQNRQRYQKWLAALEELDFDSFSRSDQVDYLMLRHNIRNRLSQLNTTNTASRGERPSPMDESGISGRPVGRDELISLLEREMIAYTPEQLIEIAEREYAWCVAEFKKASREMGFGDDWRRAVEKVKTMHVAPGQQPYLIHDLAWEAINYLKENDLLTVPPIAAETWGMQMMSPERQLVNPFFTGGSSISVSFPTDTMSHEAKLQSMRGNNIPCARATVHHELIPGHNLQGYMNSRYSSHRRSFSTSFWGEGWALYWEMLLYELGFPKTPEDRIGFLMWRSHRCARIIFSLSFHLGRMTPQECIDFLVERVCFERNNATAEVRRSFENYGPLYQAAYMLGGLQLRQLRKELVDSGKMTNREFHDAIITGGSMPIVMVRALLTDQKLTRDFEPRWLFYGTIE